MDDRHLTVSLLLSAYINCCFDVSLSVMIRWLVAYMQNMNNILYSFHWACLTVPEIQYYGLHGFCGYSGFPVKLSVNYSIGERLPQLRCIYDDNENFKRPIFKSMCPTKVNKYRTFKNFIIIVDPFFYTTIAFKSYIPPTFPVRMFYIL